MSQQPPPPLTSLSPPQPTNASLDDDDISPRTRVAPPQSKPSDYFSLEDARDKDNPDAGTSTVDHLQPSDKNPELLLPRSSTSPAPSPSISSIGEEDGHDASVSSNNGGDRSVSRKSSSASVTFRPPRNPSLPQGHQRSQRLRTSSPLPVRFKPHVGFDNLPVGEATKNNPSSITLNVRHHGYHPNRRSRTFMVGVDDHAYSDYALVWLLESLVDDGDEVVCVRVVDHATRSGEKNYQEDAKQLLKAIQEKNTQNLAISIVLEYSVGKLHATFQQLIQIHQPSMLIVGTRGRSLGGIQGLVNSRNSFSKYCLQYSPVPVVVVRPDDQRKKKKDKRTHDPARKSYAAMIAASQGKHEADSETSSVYGLENQLSADEEAHRVAAAIGLPAAFDPTIKPYTKGHHAGSRPAASAAGPAAAAASASGPISKGRPISPPPPLTSHDSEDEESGNDGEDGEDGEDSFETVSGEQVLELQRQRLHQMEVGEAKALLTSGAGDMDDDDDDEEEHSPGEAGDDAADGSRS